MHIEPPEAKKLLPAVFSIDNTAISVYNQYIQI